ncbi:hypothetical protein ABPG72_018236 [Tetrahymena utriculariae]
MQEQGIFISQPSNYSNTDNNTLQDCGPGLLKYDPRCRFWYQNALQYKSLSQNKPDFLYFGEMAQNLCQKILYFDQKSQQNFLYHAMCLKFPVYNTSNYFKNFLKSTKQLYMIEPLSQTIVYDPKHQMINFEALNFQETELLYLQDQQQAQHLNNTLNKLYSKFIIDEVHYIEQIDFSKYYKNLTTIPYQRNGSDYTVILNPIQVIAKVAPSNIINESSKQLFQICLSFVQINMISNTEMMQISIEQDKQIDLLNIFDDKSQKPYDFFSSKETKELYESFIRVFQILVYTSDNFFCVNETLVLLRLSKELGFFKQFQNIRVVGITHNHIGSILISQQHQFKAMEHFSQSILFAKYKIQNYCKSVQDPFDLNVLQSFCFQKNEFKISNHNYEQKKTLPQANYFSNKYIDTPTKIMKESKSMVRFQQSTAVAQDFVEQAKFELETIRKSNNQLNSQDSSFRCGLNRIHQQSLTKNNKFQEEIDSQPNQINRLNAAQAFNINKNSSLTFLPKYITYSLERKQHKRFTDNSLKNDQSYDHFLRNPSIQNNRQMQIQKQNNVSVSKFQSSQNVPSSLKNIISNKKIDEKIFDVHNEENNEFTLTQIDQNVCNYYEENEFANLSLSFLQLQFLINFAKTEQAIQQQDYYTGASILTQVLEEQKTFMCHQPFQIINKLLQIFQKHKIFSHDLIKICGKFNPQIQQKVGIIFGIQKDERNQKDQFNIVKTLLDADSNIKNNQMGIFFQDKIKSGYFTPFMNLVQTKQIQQ